MPWITISVAGGVADQMSTLPSRVAREAASVLGLNDNDVVVMLPAVLASWGEGAVVTMHGRAREPQQEADLMDRLRRVVADGTGLADDLVHVVRVSR